MTKGLLTQKALLCVTGCTMTIMGDGAAASFIYSHTTSLFRIRRDVLMSLQRPQGSTVTLRSYQIPCGESLRFTMKIPDPSTQSGLPRGLKGGVSCNLLNCRNKWWPYQPHPGTRVPRLGCYLPVLTRLTSYQCERTNRTTGEENRQTGGSLQWLSTLQQFVCLIFQQSAE